MVDRAEIVKRASRMKPAEPTLDFGKWKGFTVDQVLEREPGYIHWFFDHVEKGKHPKTLTRQVRAEACKRMDFAEAERDFADWEYDEDLEFFPGYRY